MSFTIGGTISEKNILPAGQYECIIKSAMQTVTRKETPYIQLQLEVRSDVPANPAKEGTILHSLWMKRQPSSEDLSCDGYSDKQIQSISKAVGIPNGKCYRDVDEWCEDLEGKTVRATIEHEEWNGLVQARVRWLNKSLVPITKQKPKSNQLILDGFTEIENDDDLPF